MLPRDKLSTIIKVNVYSYVPLIDNIYKCVQLCSSVTMTMYDPVAKDSTVTRTVRIDEAYDEVLRYEADRQGISVNTLVDRILRRYSVSYRFFENLGAVTISPHTFSDMLAVLEEEEIRAIARSAGMERPKELILKRGLPLTYENAVWYVTELLGDNSGWFRTTYYVREEEDIIHLSHNQVVGWSIFLKEYIGAFFKEVIGVILDAEVVGSSVTFTINKSKIRRDKMS